MGRPVTSAKRENLSLVVSLTRIVVLTRAVYRFVACSVYVRTTGSLSWGRVRVEAVVVEGRDSSRCRVVRHGSEGR